MTHGDRQLKITVRRVFIASGVALSAATIPAAVMAHTAVKPTPETLWSSWTLDPLLAIGMFLTSWAYLRGVAAHRRKAGEGSVLHRGHVWAWAGAMASVVVALFSPLDALGGALFSAHMVQHVLLFLVAPMLLAAARPFVAMPWALPDRSRKRFLLWSHKSTTIRTLRGASTNPIVVWMTFTGVLWIWHVPALYDAALRSTLVHRIEHLSFMAAAFVFWSWLLQSRAGKSSQKGFAVLLVFTSVIQSGLLGALLTFARSPIYEGHLPYVDAWGLTPLEDQQLAGLIMWIPMGMWFTLTTVLIFFAWLRDADRSVRQWESELDYTAPEAATSQGR